MAESRLRGRRAPREAGCLWLCLLASAPAAAGTFTVFGPETYRRDTGAPVTIIKSFSVLNPNTSYVLRVHNGGMEDGEFEKVSSSTITVNGTQVLGPDDLNQNVTIVDKPVTLRISNEIAVQVRGKPGGAIVVEVIGTDNDPPTITARADPSANGNGWNNTSVTVTFTCSDATSGIASCTGPVTLAAEGGGQVVTGTAVDGAGNTASTSVTLNVDKTPPVVTATSSPPANSNGWNNTPVTTHFTCTDAGSGIATCPPDQVVATDGANQTASGTPTDKAGNTASVTSAPFSIDQVKPTITVTLTPAPNGNGWNNAPVTVHFTCTDALSGIATCPPDQIVATDGANQTVSGTATDKAGNTASVTSAPFSIDQVKPTITVALTPAPNANGWNNTLVTAHFTCVDALSGIATCPPDQVVATDGANQIVSGTAIDKAGNTASATSAPFSIDQARSMITVALTPAPNANGWNKSPVTAQFVCTDVVSGIATCSDPVTVPTEGVQTVTGTATDRAGNTVTASSTVRIDTTPPVLTLASPVTGARLFTPTVTVTGTVTDTLSGVASVTCNGAPASVNGNSVSCDVTLTPGANSIAAAATDLAGNTSTATLALTYVRVPKVTITAPANLSYFSISPTTVTGTVDDPTATVTVNSIQAPVVNGSFSLALPLAEGPNLVTASASTPAGAVGTASIEVNLDTTPPHVTITSPPDQFITADASISVAGNVNDIVVGTVNDQQAQVTVNGASAQVANRTFLATEVPLTIGPNVIQAVARDRVGNAATTQITVMRQLVTQAQIHLISGNNQAGTIGSALPAPLVVALTDGAGNPVPNKPVIFKVTQNDGMVSTGGSPAASMIATTDGHGQAQVQWTLGNRAGAGSNSAEAYAVGFVGSAIFTATGTQDSADKIVVDTGNDQIGAIGQPLPKPFIAVVVDNGHNRLAGVPVTFGVQQGGGNFDGESSFTVETDSDGRAAATLTLGMEEGNANNLVDANFPSNQSFPAAFTASGRAPADPAKTTISGVVLDNSNLPIPGVTVRAVLTNVLHSNLGAVQAAVAVQTNAQGQFSIPQAPVGFVKLLLDGSTAQLPGTYPSLEYDIVTIAGQTNTVGQPIYLLPLNAANQLCVTATTGGGTLTIADAPGFSLTFGPGQVTFPGGSKTGCVSVTVVHGDKVPMVPGFGQQPRFIVTIQPAGAMFNPPAPITLPNVDGLKPREVTEMYSYDHDIASFVAIGTGVVSDDGQVIRSSQGVGVLKAGWHCGGNPGAVGTTANCPACEYCVGVVPPGSPSGTIPGTCVPDPNQVGHTCTPASNPCVFGTCGSVAIPPPGQNSAAGCNGPFQNVPDALHLACQTALLTPGVCKGGICQPSQPPQCDPTTCNGTCTVNGCVLATCTPQTLGQLCNAGGGPTAPGWCDVGGCVGNTPTQCGPSSGCSTCITPPGSGQQCTACSNGQPPVNGQCNQQPTVHLTWRNQTDPVQIYIREGQTVYLSSTVTATGTPAGGSFNWTSTSPDVVDFSPNNDTVTIKGLRPGQSTLFVGYSLNGQNAGASVLVKVIYPVILVHGIASGASTWDTVSASLIGQASLIYGSNCERFSPELDYCAVDFGSDPRTNAWGNQSDFITEGLALANIIDHVKAVTGAHRVTLVGHSMGGLASRAAIQLFGHTSDVDKLITLGTPHQGSWLAALNQDTFLSLTGLPELAVLAGLNPSSPGVQSLAPSSPELSQINSAPIPSIPSMLHVSIVSIDRGAALAATAAVDAQAISCLSSVTPACLGLLSHLASLNVAIPNSDLLVTTDSQNLNSVFPAVGAIVDTSLAQIHVLETASVASVLLKYLGIAP